MWSGSQNPDAARCMRNESVVKRVVLTEPQTPAVSQNSGAVHRERPGPQARVERQGSQQPQLPPATGNAHWQVHLWVCPLAAQKWTSMISSPSKSRPAGVSLGLS